MTGGPGLYIKLCPCSSQSPPVLETAPGDSSCVACRLFDDIEPALKAWSAKELKVYLFSAGTVDTQKLLFGYSAKGDLQEVGVVTEHPFGVLHTHMWVGMSKLNYSR